MLGDLVKVSAHLDQRLVSLSLIYWEGLSVSENLVTGGQEWPFPGRHHLTTLRPGRENLLRVHGQLVDKPGLDLTPWGGWISSL